MRSNQTWQTYFARELDKRDPSGENPFYAVSKDSMPTSTTPEKGAENEAELNTARNDTPTKDEKPAPKELVDFFTFSVDQKVHLLHLLCEVRGY